MNTKLQERRRWNRKLDWEAELSSQARNLLLRFAAPTRRKLRNEVVEKISGGMGERRERKMMRFEREREGRLRSLLYEAPPVGFEIGRAHV